MTSLWVGLAFAMGVREARRLPAAFSAARRIAVGVVTFLLWYAAMLSAVGVVALLTVRRAREVGLTVLALFAATSVLWGARRLLWAPPASPSPPKG